MTDTRPARKAAEKAARERLGSSLIVAVGELGAAAAQQQAAASAVPEAEEQAREHLRRAQTETEQLIDAARQTVANADHQYRTAHQAALNSGWSAAALTDMGYATPPTTRRRARPHALETSNGSSATAGQE